MRTVSRCNPNTRETSRMLIPSTITARRTRRYTSTWYIHPTTHKHDFEPMDGSRTVHFSTATMSGSQSVQVVHFTSAFYTFSISP